MSPLAVQPVEWNPSRAPVGRVSAVADAGDVVAVFGDAGATVFASGAVAATDATEKRWSCAGTIPGAYGTAQWIVGIDGDGRVLHLHGTSKFEDVSPRFGLAGLRVHDVSMLDDRRAAFLLDGEIALADGREVKRYMTGPFGALAAGQGRAALVGQGRVVVFDRGDLSGRVFELPGATYAAVGSDGRLYAATSRAIFASTASGELALVYDAEGETIHGLAASPGHVWFGDGAELGLVEGDHVAETRGANLARDARLQASPSGDVWVIGGADIQRFRAVEAAAAASAMDVEATWSSTLAPVFARACATCHMPNGVSGTDLSTSSAWQSEREAIRQRVVVSRAMPPEGHPLSDADRAAIAAWASMPHSGSSEGPPAPSGHTAR